MPLILEQRLRLKAKPSPKKYFIHFLLVHSTSSILGARWNLQTGHAHLGRLYLVTRSPRKCQKRHGEKLMSNESLGEVGCRHTCELGIRDRDSSIGWQLPRRSMAYNTMAHYTHLKTNDRAERALLSFGARHSA